MRMKKLHRLLVPVLLAGLFTYCDDKPEDGDTVVELNESQVVQPKVTPPDFNADSAYLWVDRQVKFGPRVPGTAAHTACGNWLAAELRRHGASVTEQTTTAPNNRGQQIPVRNIIASYNPDAKYRILLSAHWDSRPVADEDPERPTGPIDGANDGASGVGVLLELARCMKGKLPADLGVDIALWDAEDGGESNNNESWCLGSRHWAKNPHKPGYKAQYGVNLDMVGAKDATFPMEGYSHSSAGATLERIWQNAHHLGYGKHFLFTKSGEILDDHSVVGKAAGMAYIDIIHLNTQEYGKSFFEHWHTHGDNMSVIDKNTLKAVGQTLVFTLCQGAL